MKFLLFALLFLPAFSFANTNYVTTGVIYANERSENMTDIKFFPVSGSPEYDFDFEQVGLSVGYLSTGPGFGFGTHLDLMQISQGLAQQSDQFAQIGASWDLNYSFADWLTPFLGINGAMNYVKTGTNTYTQVFGGMGWQYGVTLHWNQWIFDVYRFETTDGTLKIFGGNRTTFRGTSLRFSYGW